MVSNIIEEVKKGLTGDPLKDIKYLQEQAAKYKDSPDSAEILKILSDMSFELLPDESKAHLKNAMFIEEKRIDQVYNEINGLVKDNKLEDAEKLFSEIEKKADKYFSETEASKKFSFRNRLDEYIYTHIYKPNKKYERTPFDFCQYFSSYGYLLVEQHKPQEAVDKLEKAIRYNPVNVEPRFELAEAFKLMHEPQQLFACVRDTLEISTTPYHIARCYTNLGYYCIEIKDYDSAVCFYYESLIYAQNEAVNGELQHIRAITGKQVVPPTREEVLSAFEKYKIRNGPNPEVVNIAYSLGSYCMEHNAPPQETLFYMQIVYNLTNSNEVKEIIEKLNAQLAAQRARNN